MNEEEQHRADYEAEGKHREVIAAINRLLEEDGQRLSITDKMALTDVRDRCQAHSDAIVRRWS